MSGNAAEALARAAAALLEAARSHKRASLYHRRKARELMAEHARLTQGEGERSHGR